MVLLGKTNTPEFGLTPYTEPEAFGPTRNPWDPSRTAGGSSGGSATAVAADLECAAGRHEDARADFLRAAALAGNALDRATMQRRAGECALHSATLDA